jgi:hypothetical protein
VEEFLRWSPNVRSARDRREVEAERRARATAGPPEELAEPAADPGPDPDSPAGARPEVEESPDETEPPPLPDPDPESEPEPVSPVPPVDHYDDLASEEIISLLGSLERPDLETLRAYERDHAGRRAVLSAIDSVLARAPAAS